MVCCIKLQVGDLGRRLRAVIEGFFHGRTASSQHSLQPQPHLPAAAASADQAKITSAMNVEDNGSGKDAESTAAVTGGTVNGHKSLAAESPSVAAAKQSLLAAEEADSSNAEVEAKAMAAVEALRQKQRQAEEEGLFRSSSK